MPRSSCTLGTAGILGTESLVFQAGTWLWALVFSLSSVRAGTGAARLAAVPESAAATVAGTATIFQHGRGKDIHFSVRVQHGDVVIHTEKFRLANGQTITMPTGVSRGLASVVHSQDLALPNAAVAHEFQRSVVGTSSRAFNATTENYLTHCADVVRAGGRLDAPATARKFANWLLGQGSK